ncbi:hypothetical protein LEQ04_02990 [Riemerella anatipestifer]|nr:hypothetical protein LEQ04_02990 [Riemerella anatipestifer]
MDCGPACLAMVSRYFGRRYSIEYLRENSFITREGVSLLGISEAAKEIGIETQSVKLSVSKLLKQSKLFPCILHWNQNHFVVLFAIRKSFFLTEFAFVLLIQLMVL